MKKNDIWIYQSLFRKTNLSELDIVIPPYMQPLVYVSIITDPLIQRIIDIIGFCGGEVHKHIFKNKITEMTDEVIDEDTNEVEYCAYMHRTTLDQKLSTMHLISILDINEHTIRLTTQGMSYYMNKYTKIKSKLTFLDKLSIITSVKLFIYNINNGNTKNTIIDDSALIYKLQDNKFIILEDEREYKEHYLNKYFYVKEELVKQYIIEMERNDSTHINDKCYNIEIWIEKDVYVRYRENIDKILNVEKYKEYKDDSIRVINVEYKICFIEI